MAEPIIVTGSSVDDEPRIAAAGKSFEVHEWSGCGPDYLHVHHSDDEAWHVLEGTLTFKFIDQVDSSMSKREYEVEAHAGTTVFVPAGLPHSFYEAQGPTRYLIILTPKLRALIDELHSTPIADHGEVMLKYDSEIVE